jgi:hypothetical protein
MHSTKAYSSRSRFLAAPAEFLDFVSELICPSIKSSFQLTTSFKEAALEDLPSGIPQESSAYQQSGSH